MHVIAEVSTFIHFGLRDQSIQQNVKPILGSVFFISSIAFDEEISCSEEIDFHVESDTIQLTMSFPLLSHKRIAPSAHTKHDAHHAKHTSISILRFPSESIHFGNVFRSAVCKHNLTGLYFFPVCMTIAYLRCLRYTHDCRNRRNEPKLLSKTNQSSLVPITFASIWLKSINVTSSRNPNLCKVSVNRNILPRAAPHMGSKTDNDI